MNNKGLVVPPITPQPETIMIECSAQNSSQTTDNYDEWEVAIPPVRLEQGDEISVNTSFLEARGTSGDILEFSSKGANQNNQQTIYYDFYSCDDGTSDKNKGKDWINYSTNNTTADSRFATGKTYKPCKAIRYDRLFEETTFNANGNAFNRKQDNGTTTSVVSTTTLNPFVANAFNISPREDYLVGGIFNSTESIKELNNPADTYIGGINTLQHQQENAKYLRLTDACINLDAFPYWEIAEERGTNVNRMVWIRVPYTEKGTNYLAQFPIGSTIQIGVIPKRRQMSYYDLSPSFNTIPDRAYNINAWEHINGRLNGVLGTYFISEMREGFFSDNPSATSGITEVYGWNGVKCFQIGIRQRTPLNKQNIACPLIRKDSMSILANSQKIYGTSATNNEYYINPFTTQSKVNLKDGNQTSITVIPVNLMIRRSQFYVGSQFATTSFDLPDDIQLLPSCRVAYGDNYRNTNDAQLYDLYPKQSVATAGDNHPISNANIDLDIYVGSYHFNNATETYSTTAQSPQTRLTPFTQLSGGSIGTLVNYWTANKTAGRAYNPLQHAFAVELLATDAFATFTFTIDTTPFHKQYWACNTIAVLNYNVANEEVVILGSAFDIQRVGGTNVFTYKVEILARNITSNQNIWSPAPPTYVAFDADNPIEWIDNPDQPVVPKTTSSYVEWYDFEEGKSADLKIDPILLKKNLPTGIPILKNNGYMGNNEPELNESPLYIEDIMNSWKYGGNFILYRNTTRLNGEGELPDSSWSSVVGESATLTKAKARLGSSRGCWMFNLSEAVPLTSNAQSSGTRTDPLTNISEQITCSSTSPNAMVGSADHRGQAFGEINMNVINWDMKFDYELGRNFVGLDGFGKTFCNNLYTWTPDAYDSLISSDSPNSLKHISNQGVDLLCGFVPLINKITLTTPKDYLTPDDLSNYWTEELHKLKNLTNLFDGTEIEGSAQRGVLQNPLLMPIYGSWGLGNTPQANGLLARDYITFPHTNGYALGSVVFIDGHAQASDWGTIYDDIKNITSYIYPRTPNNLVNLWDTGTKKKLPTYATTRQVIWNNVSFSLETRTHMITSYPTTTGFSYPTATSALCNNTNLSNNAPTTNSPAITQDNLSTTPRQAEPKYDGSRYDGYDLWTLHADYPFDGLDSSGTAIPAPREDPIYRETQDYPLNFFKDPKYNNYLRFSQYIGTDNMTLSYNTLVSAFEFQFLHQPYATSFQLVEGQAEGGDNAIRIFDNIPKEVSNWERYGGLNVRNWCSPNLSRGYYTQGEIENPPSWTNGVNPNGLNPETTLELVGITFMEKLGFNKSQLTTTNVKGIEGIGIDPVLNLCYVYEPNGTTGADPDIADAIINTSVSAEDNPNSEAHNGKGQLIFYPSSADTTQKAIRHTKDTSGLNTPIGVRYDYSYTNYGQRGGLKTTNHNKSYGFPNITGSPLVKDITTFPKTLNPDGEQRSGYTIEIGSSPIRAQNLPIKLTDGYYYILCPNLIDDPQFYITANNGSVIPAIAIISKNYVSGDFYTSFQSPITFYCKRAKILSSIKVQIRNSSMGIPSNLGKNSSVIFSIKRFNPKPPEAPLTTSQQQDLDYKQLQKEANKGSGKTHINKILNVMGDIFGLDQSILVPTNVGIQTDADEEPAWIDINEMDRGTQVNPEMADASNQSSEYYGQLLDRINTQDIGSMSRQERDTFFNTDPMGIGLKAEMSAVLQERQHQVQAENQGDPVQLLVEEIDRENIRNAPRGMFGRNMITELGEQPIETGRREPPIDYSGVERGGATAEVAQLKKEVSKDSGMGTSVATTAPSRLDSMETTIQEED